VRPLLFLATTLLLAPLAVGAELLPTAVGEALDQGYHSSDPEVLKRAAGMIEAQVKAEPDNRELQHALAILYLDRLHDPARAVPYLEKIVADSPNDSAWHHALARAMRATKQADRAAAHFAKAAELKPGDAWVRYELGNTLSEAGRFGEAATAYRAALEFDGKNTDTRLALAKTLWAAGEAAEASATARTILEYDPLNSAARKLLLAEQAPEPAPPVAPVPVPPTPPPVAPPKPVHPADAAVAAAYASGNPADFARAAQVLEKTLRQSPRDLPRRKTLAYLYLDKLQSPAQAVPHFTKVVELTPRNGAWWSLLAKAQEAAGDEQGAMSSYRRAAENTPRDVWSRYHLACSLRRQGRRVEAEDTFREALRIEPKNRYVRRELARCAYDAGRKKEAVEIARELINEEPADADARALLGDVQRSQFNFAAAGAEYQAALAAQPSHAIALAGLSEIRRQKRPEVKLSYYTFDDTDGLRQSGLFSYASTLLTGRLKASVSVNQRYFKQAPFVTVDRLETGAGFDYRVFSTLQIAAGAGQFKTENYTAKFGGNVALYYQPASFADVWASYRSAEPVNDSYTTASLAFSQSIIAAGLNLRPFKSIALSATASQSRYSDDNTRQSALASASWYVPLWGSPVVRMEYEWLNYDRNTSAYSSPDNYARFRPVLEFSPRLTDWLKIELHGELSYVFDEEQWGTGFTAGVRVNKGDSFDLGLGYMEYEIPGGQTTWSGSGWKVDLTARF
jgi:tetratricopeptide (TPR) repeat protein